MSAPNTNVEKQTQQHRPALSGMALVVAFAGLLLVLFTAWIVAQGNTPRDASVIDGRTGEVVSE